MRKNEELPSPEKLARELRDLRDLSLRLVREYKAVYTASLRPDGGGSLGQIGGKGSASDPTASTAMSPQKNQLRFAAKSIARAVAKATEALERGEERGWKAFQELPGGTLREEFERRRDVRREWRVHRWTTLACGCARDDEGWWVVSQACSEHVPLIPDAYRGPFLEVPAGPPTPEYGPFRPEAVRISARSVTLRAIRGTSDE